MASKDITYCMKNDCEIESCFRNPKNIHDDDFYSFADLENTEDCLKAKEGGVMTLKIELTEEQLQLLINALEVNFRFMMGQGNIVADLLSQCPDKSKFDDETAWDRSFDRYLLTRDFAGVLLSNCSKILYERTLHEDAHRLSDMWSVLRNTQYNLHDNKDDWDVRSHTPFQMSDWDLMKVEVQGE